MERREDIRAAMHNLLSQGKPHESTPANPPSVHPERAGSIRKDDIIPSNSLSWEFLLSGMQEELKSVGILAEREELIDAIGTSLSLRLDLVRYLIASYLTGENHSGNQAIQYQTGK